MEKRFIVGDSFEYNGNEVLTVGGEIGRLIGNITTGSIFNISDKKFGRLYDCQLCQHTRITYIALFREQVSAILEESEGWEKKSQDV